MKRKECLSAYLTGRRMEGFSKSIIALSLPVQFNHWFAKTARLTPPFPIISLLHTKALIFFCFFSFAGRGVGAICELKPKKNRVISLAM